jgi:O-antigen biosynthesis protein
MSLPSRPVTGARSAPVSLRSRSTVQPTPSHEGSRPGISVVIVSYNVREYLDACLQSVMHASQHFQLGFEVIVFDNASRDGTVPLLKPRWPGVNWISSDRNLGFGSGCNRGAAIASYDLLLFLNPDTLVSEDTFQVMWDFFASRDDIGVAGCKIVNRDGSLQLACKRSFPSPAVAAYKFMGLSSLFPKSRVFGQYNLTFLDENATHEVDAVSGSFLCMRSDLYRQIGGYDEDFFMYGEDLDICYRVKLLGKRNFYHPGTKVIHFKGESAKSAPLRSFLYFYEAMLIFSRKHLELRPLPLLLFHAGIASLAVVNFLRSRLMRWLRWSADLFLVNVTLALVTSIYQGWLNMTPVSITHPSLYLFWHVLVSLTVLLPLSYIGDYGRVTRAPKTVFLALTIAFLAFFSLSFFIREEAYSRVVFGITAAIGVSILPGWRWVLSQGGRVLTRIVVGPKRVAVVGVGERARTLAELIQGEQIQGLEFVGFIQLGGARPPRDLRGSCIGDLKGLKNLVGKADLHQVIVAVEEGAYEMALKVLSDSLHGQLEVRLLVGDPVPGASFIDLNNPGR